MKKIIIMSMIVIFSMGMAYAQDTKKESKSVNGAKIVFATMEHNYGTIMKGGDGNCVFEFTNEGNEPLILSNVRTSCGCTIPQWEKAPVMPHQKGKIKVRYDTNRRGSFVKTITVTSNSIETPTIVLKIRGTVKAS